MVINKRFHREHLAHIKSCTQWMNFELWAKRYSDKGNTFICIFNCWKGHWLLIWFQSRNNNKYKESGSYNGNILQTKTTLCSLSQFSFLLTDEVDHILSLPVWFLSLRPPDKNCLCLLICQSAKNGVDSPGMAHRAPPTLILFLWSFNCVLMSTWPGFAHERVYLSDISVELWGLYSK